MATQDFAMQKVLILGASGMLGSSAYRLFAESSGFSVTGTTRSMAGLDQLPRGETCRIIDGIDVADTEALARLLNTERPSVVVNCVGVIKQIAAAKDPVVSISINALLPHRLAVLCAAAGARLVQISTDCVFNGRRGGYRESDMPDAEDLYGRTKLLGEVDYPNAVTLRTSIIGHELGTSISLVDWFLSQSGPTVCGYRKAIYSGLPTIELARVIRDIVIPLPQLTGLWHVASDPINKYDLLRLVADVYERRIEILPDDTVAIDRSLDGSRFREATGYVAAPWRDLVTVMHGSR
jgi:dTDP-4-dehydrorhamnose reductase